MQPIEIHQVPDVVERIRIQEYGVGIFKNCPTKSALKKRINKGLVTIDDKIAKTSNFINGGEVLKLFADRTKRPIFPLKLKVLHEDEHLAIVHKPPGVLVSGNSYQTIANALEYNLKPSKRDGTRPLPIHRLDYATTGTLLVGKTGESIRTLYELFEKKRITKTYLAITIGDMNKDGRMDSKVEGKKAQSTYRVLDSVSSERFKRLNLLELKPLTGRRHQLRKHLFEMGNPILGDKDYYLEQLVLHGKGMYLHAYSLSFEHPINGTYLKVVDNELARFEKIFPKMKEFLGT